MKKIVYFVLCIICLCLCSCGSNKKESETVVLNENGKEEIIFCTLAEGRYLREAIVEYNKQSTRYEIVLATMEDMPYIEYRKRVQLDLMNGNGPDILCTDVLNSLDMKPYVEKGYFMDLTDFINEQEPLVEKVVKYNEIDGKIYGIPSAYSISLCAVKKDYETDSKNFTKEYCMELMENSNATFGVSPFHILRFFGVGVSGTQSFVDVESGISHFDDKEFIELLEFVKKYRCVDDGRTLKGRIAAGTQLFVNCGFQSFKNFWEIEGYFKGTPCYIGFPTEEGNKSYLMVYSYYINEDSKHKEGALDFMRFLMSDEQQLKQQDIGDSFTVKQKLLEESWEKAKQEPYMTNYGFQTDDVFYQPRVMTDEEEEIFWEMLDNSVYEQSNDIELIIYEEIPAFFDGNKTAEEVAKIIDNRVQLYLDEKK